MQRMIVDRLKALLQEGKADRVLGWQAGEFFYDHTPAFLGAAEMDNLVYDSFCGSNVSKYLIAESNQEGKVAALLKPCDTYSLNQLITEKRVDREKVYVVGLGCRGMLDMEKLRKLGCAGATGVEEEGDTLTVHTLYGDRVVSRKDALLEKCLTCKGKEHKIADEILGESEDTTSEERMARVAQIEAMTPEERFQFWRGELSRCIRCNACRNVCPACSCVKCVFDNPKSGVSNKAAADDFEENMFHIIRAFHVAGRCTDCGECSRVCPQGIPLHLLNRKFIKDIDEFYGEYQAGEEIDQRHPLTNYQKDDCEPSVVYKRGGDKA